LEHKIYLKAVSLKAHMIQKESPSGHLFLSVDLIPGYENPFDISKDILPRFCLELLSSFHRLLIFPNLFKFFQPIILRKMSQTRIGPFPDFSLSHWTSPFQKIKKKSSRISD
jgi:hypothetical protein